MAGIRYDRGLGLGMKPLKARLCLPIGSITVTDCYRDRSGEPRYRPGVSVPTYATHVLPTFVDGPPLTMRSTVSSSREELRLLTKELVACRESSDTRVPMVRNTTPLQPGHAHRRLAQHQASDQEFPESAGGYTPGLYTISTTRMTRTTRRAIPRRLKGRRSRVCSPVGAELVSRVVVSTARYSRPPMVPTMTS